MVRYLLMRNLGALVSILVFIVVVAIAILERGAPPAHPHQHPSGIATRR